MSKNDSVAEPIAALQASVAPDREAVAALLERHNLPSLESIDPVPADATDSFLINGRLVLRLDRDEHPSAKLAKEALIYRRLRRSTDARCPEVIALDTTRDLIAAEVLIYTQPAGVRASDVWDSLPAAARDAVSEEAGQMCGAIHNLQWAGYGDFNVATGTFGQYPRWTDLMLARAERLATRAMECGALPEPVVFAALTELNDGDSVLTASSPPRLVHSDIHAGNLLIEEHDGHWRITALVGWSRALTADAGYEFATISMSRPDRKLPGDAFVHGYRERHLLQVDLRSRVHLYQVLLHLEGALVNPERRWEHEQALRRLLGRI